MILLIVTDIHSNLRYVEKLVEEYGNKYFDYLLINGDITHFGDIGEAINILSTFSNLSRKSFFIPGNCDPKGLLSIEEAGNAKNIHGKTINLNKYKLHGLGGSNKTPFHTFIEFDEEEIRNLLNWDIDKPFILLSHTPPNGTKIDKVFLGRHVGSNVIREYILKKKPILSIHGHVHEARGIDKIGETTILNPGPLRNGYYAIIEFKDETFKINLYRLTK